MKRLPFRNIMLLSSLCALYSCSSTSKEGTINAFPTMMWQDKPVVVDGNNDDWSLPYSYSDSKAKIEYSYANDRDNLYITMKSGDKLTQLKILHAGMQVWIDPLGKKNKTTGLSYPLANTTAMNMPRKNGETGRDTTRMRTLLEDCRDFSLQGFKGCNGGFLVAQQNPCGIQVKIGEDPTGELIWEAAIPLKSFIGEAALKNLHSKPLSICFEINALKRPAGSSEGGGGHMGGGGMGGGRRGGGMGGMHGGGGGGRRGGMGGGSGDRAELFGSTVSWDKANLAKPKAN